MRFARVLAVVALLVPLLAASRSGAQSIDGAKPAIRELLERRVEAVRTEDRKGFLATVARDDEGFVASQRRWFDNVGTVPLASYDLGVDWDLLGDLSTPSLGRRYRGAQRVVLPVTRERYRIAGYDAKPVVQRVYFTFVERGGEWRVASDSDVADVGLKSARAPWHFGPLVARRSEHFLLLQHPCDGTRCPVAGIDFLEIAERALDRIEDRWKGRWSRRVVVYEPRGGGELRELLGVSFDTANFIAFAVTQGEAHRSPSRIVVSPEGIAERSASDVIAVLTHELAHVAFRPLSGSSTPLFIEEGLAEYIGRAGDSRYVDDYEARLRGRAHLPSDSQFTTGTGPLIFDRYQAAHSAVRFFVRRYGFGEFLRFYRLLGRLSGGPGTANYHLGRALDETVGLDFRAFARRWADTIGR